MSRYQAFFASLSLLTLLTFAGCGDKPAPPANNGTNSNNASAPNGAKNGERQRVTSPTASPRPSKLYLDRQNGGGTPAPSVAPQAGPAPQALNDQNRTLIKYYNYLAKNDGLKVGPPREMPGGPKIFSAEDMLQFTIDEPKIAVMIAKFSDDQSQQKGGQFLAQLSKDGRKQLQVGHYTLIVKGGDDKVYKILTQALEKFETKS